MTCVCTIIALPPRDYDAVFFDLNNVLTRRVNVQAAPWKILFDAYPEQHSALTGKVLDRFDLDADCRRYADERTRHHAHPYCHDEVRQEAAENHRAPHRPSDQRCPVEA